MISSRQPAIWSRISVLEIFAAQDPLAQPVDLGALKIHDIVVFLEVFADIEVAAFHPFLRVRDGTRDDAGAR